MTEPGRSVRRFAVVGDPIEHSLSPVLHRTAFAALHLPYQYERIRVGAGGLATFVAGLSRQWCGLSVTMPGKFEALTLATRVSDRARRVGSANTLVREGADGADVDTGSGWYADCTDVDGATALLDECGAAGRSAVVVGAGGTSRPVFAALAERGFIDVVVLARDRDRARPAVGCAGSFGLDASWAPLTADAVPAADVVVSTLPGHSQPDNFPLMDALSSAAPAVADVAYAPWPTLLAAAAQSKGARVAGGLTMLLHQAFAQTELFTGRPAPREAMRVALREHQSQR